MTEQDSTLRAEALGWVASMLAWERPTAPQSSPDDEPEAAAVAQEISAA